MFGVIKEYVRFVKRILFIVVEPINSKLYNMQPMDKRYNINDQWKFDKEALNQTIYYPTPRIVK